MPLFVQGKLIPEIQTAVDVIRCADGEFPVRFTERNDKDITFLQEQRALPIFNEGQIRNFETLRGVIKRHSLL